MPTDKKTDKPKQTPNKPKTVKESKEVYFKRIAGPRVKNVKKALRILGNCSNRTNYAYTSEQVDKMFLSITETMENIVSKFTLSKQEVESFEFD